MQNKILLFILLVFNVSVGVTNGQCPPTNGLIHHYKFDGNTNDAIGNNNATLSSTVGTAYVTSKDNRANGALDLGGYDKALSISTISVSTDFTISFWFKHHGGPMCINAQNTGVGSYHDGSNPTTFVGIGGDGSNSNFVSPAFGIYRQFSPTFDQYKYFEFLPNPNAPWRLITFVKEGDSVSIYGNNIFRTKEKSAQAIAQINYLFGHQTTSGNIRGWVDDYRMYNRALSASEINTIFTTKYELQITQDLESINICPKESGAKLTVICDSATQFDWYRNNTLMATTLAPEYVFMNASNAVAGQYFVIAKNCDQADTSSTVSVTYGLTDLNTGLVAFYPYPNGAAVPSAVTGNILPNNSSQGVQFNAPNRFSRGHNSIGVSDINTSLVLQNSFSDATSTTSFWYKYNANNFGSVRHLVRTTNGNFAPVIAYQGKIGYDEPSGITWSANQVFTPNAWHHIVLVRDGANAKIYMDKQLVVNRNNATTQQVIPITGLGGPGSVYGTAIGFYDDLRLYDYPVNQEMVDRLYAEIVHGNVGRTAPGISGFSFCNGANLELMTFGNSSDTLNPVQYQWLKDGVALNNTSRIKGARTADLSIANFIASDAGIYECSFTTSCLGSTTDSINVTYSANTAPVFSVTTQQPLCSGSTGTNVINLISNVGPTPTVQIIYHNGYSQVSSPHIVAPGRHTYRVTNTSDLCPVTKTVQVMNPTEPIGIYDEFSNQNCGSFASTVSAVSCGPVSGNQWFHLMNSQGKVVASVNSNGQNLGNVTATLHNERLTLADVNANNNLTVFSPKYMNKTWVLNSANPFNNPVNVRFYYMREDLDTLKTATGCLTCTPQDLILSHISGNNEDCNPTNTTPTNFNLYWNKNVPNPTADNAMIQSYVSGSLNNLYHNQPLTNVGGSKSDGMAWNGHYFEAVVNQFSEFRMHMLGNTAPLPVQWLSFDAYKNINQVELAWTVAHEENCKGYTMQRSLNSYDWENIGFVERKQNSSLENSYAAYDEPKANGKVYYRIIQEDLVGRQSFSEIRTIFFETENGLQVYPNPTANAIQYSFYTKENVSGFILLRSITGQLLMQQKADKNGSIDLSSLSKGMYILQYQTGQMTQSMKVMKK